MSPFSTDIFCGGCVNCIDWQLVDSLPLCAAEGRVEGSFPRLHLFRGAWPR
jgi:hypothetical protein